MAESRVAMLIEPRRIEMRIEPVPVAPAGGIVVRVRAALTDGTDLKAYRRGHPQMPMPTRFGHEFSGDVAAVGADVTAFEIGDAVMCVHSAPCGTCFWCAHDQEELCESVMATMILGAYADYVGVPAHIVARNCYPKPPNLSYKAAAFLEPLACVVHSVEFLSPAPGALVAVLGVGGFGLLHAQLLRECGMRPLLIGRRAERLELARSFGIEVVDLRSEAANAAILERTDGRGADAVVECTGSEDVWQDAPGMVRRGGTVSFFGGLPASARVSFSAARMHYDEVRLISPFHFGPRAVRRAYDLLCDGTIAVAPLISHTFPLDEIGAAFARLDGGEGIKFAFEP
jgi:L-iditol 2-dehydrogenase